MEIRKRTGAATWLLGILAAVMLICSGKTAYAAEQAELSGGNVDAENGKTVQYAVTLEFEVDKDAQAKDYEVKLEVTQAINLEGQDISVAAKNGNISVVPCIHEKEWKVTKPGCETAGKKEYVCTKCGEVFESEELPATGHVDTEIRNQKEAGAEPGYTGDTYCRTCGKLIQAGSVIPAVKETEKETETVAEQETTAQQTTAEETKKSVSEKIGNALKTGDAAAIAAIAVMAVLLAASGVLAFATRKKMIVRKK